MQAVRARDRRAAAGLPTSGGAVAEALGWGEAKACYILRIADGLLPRVEALGGDVVLTRLAYRDLLALVADQPAARPERWRAWGTGRKAKRRAALPR
jgi:hypothetical protein